MKKPYPITIFVYADTPDEAGTAQEALFEFVSYMRNAGAVVSARKVVDALRRFARSPLLVKYFDDGE